MSEQLLANGYNVVNPSTEAVGVYWVAVLGKTMAVIPPDAGQSCIAGVEHEMVELFSAQGSGWGDTYVTWQPKDHSAKGWERWSKKWSIRTGGRTA